MIYTSGTTGPPKGALHAHRVLPGHVPGVQMAQEFMPQPGDQFWTPADWAWAGGLLNCAAAGADDGRAGRLLAGAEIRSGPRLSRSWPRWACATPSFRRPRCG